MIVKITSAQVEIIAPDDTKIMIVKADILDDTGQPVHQLNLGFPPETSLDEINAELRKHLDNFIEEEKSRAIERAHAENISAVLGAVGNEISNNPTP